MDLSPFGQTFSLRHFKCYVMKIHHRVQREHRESKRLIAFILSL